MTMRESFESTSASPDKQKQSLIIEHATLAAKFASDQEELFKDVIVERLREIEAELAMSAGDIAREALRLYKSQYR
jgi:hypothetical protein